MDDKAPENSAQSEMPKYRAHKQVWALEIATVTRILSDVGPDYYQGEMLTFAEKGYAPILAPAEMTNRYTPVAGDFYVVYADGYKSFSPRKAFLEGYSRI